MMMSAEEEIKQEAFRVIGGLVGLAMCAGIVYRLWHRIACYGAWYGETIGRTITGRADSRYFEWKYGFLEVWPSGTVAASATIIVAVSCLLGAILNRMFFFWLAGAVVVTGYLVNAYLFCQVLSAY